MELLLCLAARLNAVQSPGDTAAASIGETVIKATTGTTRNSGPNSPNRVLPGESPVRKNYILPAIEIPSFLLLLNGYDRLRYGKEIYGTDFSTFKDHLLHGPWKYDQDPFAINQLAHPLQGATMYGFARASGLNFWEGLLYSNVGSTLWELGGETGHPSINDQITTGNAGSLFGEELYRIGSLVLERGSQGGEKPSAWREWLAAAISPPTGFNRLLFGDRYRWMESRDPATFTRLRLGQSRTASVSDTRADTNDLSRQHASIDFVMDYGLPGKDGYRYIRPLDYFSLQITGAANNRIPLESIMTRGILIGSKYELGSNYRGVWGLYGSYDYISPQIFRVSNTATSIGSTAEWLLHRYMILQGTLLTGVGFGAAGSTLNIGERNYHYGATPQGLLSLRLILRDRIMLESTAREYLVSALGGTESGSEGITRVDASLTFRVYAHHALGVQYIFSRRDARYGAANARRQSVGFISVAYNLLGRSRFGAVNWER